MGFFGKIFGKKEDDLDQELGGMENPGDSLHQDGLDLEEKPVVPGISQPPQDFGSQSPLSEHPAAPAMARPQISVRDIDLLNSKLDTLKAILNSMDQRIANLEKAAGVEQQKKMPW